MVAEEGVLGKMFNFVNLLVQLDKTMDRIEIKSKNYLRNQNLITFLLTQCTQDVHGGP